jgi:hypothetical protein
VAGRAATGARELQTPGLCRVIAAHEGGRAARQDPGDFMSLIIIGNPQDAASVPAEAMAGAP